MRVLISGASGLVGTALAESLRTEGHRVTRLVRPSGTPSPGDARWDPAARTADAAAMEGADAVVHLSGANIAGGRWTAARKEILRSSRVDTTRFLVETLARLRQKPRVLISASAIGYYGNRGDEALTESSPAGSDFPAMLARDWEAEAARAEASGIRTAIFRFGVVLSTRGGMLPRVLTPFKLGAGGRLGNGQQWMSWIALEDAVAAIGFVMTREELNGTFNIVSPAPVRNSEFTRALARAVRRPAIFPVPAPMLRLVLGEMAQDLMLASQRVMPERLRGAGFSFRYGTLDGALQAILSATK